MQDQELTKDAPADRAGPPEAGPAQLDAALQGHIGRYLRHLYDDVVQQPVPDRFKQLLDELERKSAARPAAPGEATPSPKADDKA